MKLSNRALAGTLAAVVGIAVIVAGVSAVRAEPNPELPAVSATQLLASSLDALSKPTAVSGDVSTRIDLGLPDLPAALGGGYLGPVSSIIGDQRFKVWLSADGTRVAHLLPFDEQDLVASRRDLWAWDSRTMTATHSSLAGIDGGPPSIPPHSMADLFGIAQQTLTAVEPYAEVAVDRTARVAGRAVYELSLTPRSTLTRVGRIVASIDSESRLPLRLEVFPRGGSKPALAAGFTQVSFAAIPSQTFEFTSPPGATVKQFSDRRSGPTGSYGGDVGEDGVASQIGRVRTFGDGFDLRWALRLDGRLPPEVAALLPYEGPLASATIARAEGTTWLQFGFVDLSTLRQDAARLP
jgi:outer membrane lipoprotein-sorting protein